MISEIYPTEDGNCTVIGKYPFKLPENVREIFTSNKNKFLILQFVRNQTCISFFNIIEEAEKAGLELENEYWIIHPVEVQERIVLA